MKVFVSILKVLLAFWTIMGAAYMVGHYADLVNPSVLIMVPGIFWMALGIVQIVLALALIASLFKGRLSTLSSPVAIVMALLALAGSVLYSAYSGFPGILWALIPAVLFAFIAYKK